LEDVVQQLVPITVCKRMSLLVSLPGLSGFALCGFGTGESVEAQQKLLKAALERLPREKMRLVSGLVSGASATAARALLMGWEAAGEEVHTQGRAQGE